MPNSKQHIDAAMKVYETYWESYLNGDMDAFSETMDEQFEVIGTSESEIAHSKSQGLAVFKAQMEEIIGKVEKRNRQVSASAIGELLLVNELCDIYFKNEDSWNFYSRLRISTFLRETREGWKVAQQHGSLPDNRVEGEQTIALEKIGKENIELRDAVRRRTAELESKNRELLTEASLERIRTQVTAMRESAELLDIVVTMRTEFLALGHEAHYFWYMRWLPEKYEKAMTSGDGTRIGMVMSLPRHIHGDVKLVADWEKSDVPTLVFPMDVETAVDYVHKMITLGDFEQVDPQAPSLDDIRHIGGLTFVMARTTNGEIGFSLPGEVTDPPKDAVETLARFAGVFDLAYKRFEDLKTAEKDIIEIKAARQKAEEALAELKATQTQLIQQEKLASLGQLTAGIAHEIKNPLNFVNNFSEVSIEMIDEALDGLALVKTQHAASPMHAASPLEAIHETETILQDIKSNLRKIHEHGARADSIVKSMLMHSRGGSGKMEPTDLNALIREYVNLSFHGMRAGKKPINVEIQLDLDEKLGNVNLISEDFSRVVLNLVNNAFDAMREKTKTDPGYKPVLSINTKQKENAVEIAITDNGPGIPDEIKDKILQPFFTTKKGTEGTGLGLSITHDIVKAHGGELGVKTTEGEGSEFIIRLISG